MITQSSATELANARAERFAEEANARAERFAEETRKFSEIADRLVL
jgi:hypothetical protein